MKILHIIPTYLPAYRYGGPIKSVHQLNKWLVRKGCDITVYTTNLDGPYKLNVPLNKEVIIDGVKIYYFPATFRPWEYSYSLHRSLAKNIKDFDLIHITSVFLSASTLGAYYAKKFNKPYIISPRGSLMIEPLRKKSPLKKRIYISLIERNNLEDASAIHFTTEAEKDEYFKAGLPLNKGIIIPNGFDPEEFQSNDVGRRYIGFRERWGIGKEKKIVLFLSRLNWKKGLDTLIPAFREVIKKEPKVILVLAGGDDEGYSNQIGKMVLSSGFNPNEVISINQHIYQHKSALNPKIIFTGMITGEDKVAAFQESDVFVLPSYSENFGQVVVEAMYFGLPVIITRNVGIASSVEKVQAGLVIEKDEKQLAEAILKIFKNPDLAKKMREQGKRLVETEFSWPEIADKFIEEYNDLIYGSKTTNFREF